MKNENSDGRWSLVIKNENEKTYIAPTDNMFVCTNSNHTTVHFIIMKQIATKPTIKRFLVLAMPRRSTFASLTLTLMMDLLRNVKVASTISVHVTGSIFIRRTAWTMEPMHL
jgi:hypothetical protein